MKTNYFISLLICIFITLSTIAQEKVQWRGPDRDGKYPAKDLLTEWPESGPEMLWSYEGLGKGFTSVTVGDNRIFTTGQTDGTGFLFAFNKKGNLIWKKEYGKEWNEGYPGARTTPLLYKTKLYFLSGYGKAYCFDAQSGDNIWTVDLMDKFGARNIKWGFVENPLLYDDKIIFTPGGVKTTLVALNPENGKTIWTSQANGETSAYCSPILANHNGNKLIVTSTASHIVGFDAETGKFLWQYPQTNRYSIHPNAPFYKDGYVLSVTGYGTGSTMLKLSDDGKSVTKVWYNPSLDNQIGGAIWLDEGIIGSGHQSNRAWQCLDPKTGEVKFETKDIWKGAVIYADAMIYCYSDKGELGIMKVKSDEFELISKFRIKMGTEQHWAHPVIDNGVLYMRRGNALMAFDIKKK